MGVLAVASLAAAQPAALVNADLRARSAAGGLGPVLDGLARDSAAGAWAGWEVPARGEAEMCCWTEASDSRCAGCRLDGGSFGIHRAGTDAPNEAPAVRLAAARRLLVLARLEDGAVTAVRPFSEGCPIDAGGATVHWLNDVRPSDSVAVLAALVSDDAARASRRLADGALAALAHHADASAEAALEGLVAPGRARRVREQAAFWMGQTGGAKALDRLIRLAGADRDERFREHLTFVLSQSEDARALDALVGMARNDSSRRVRGQALFWLGQKAGRKAVAAIETALREDPDTEIKKKAVFALSQLPKDEGVPLLIRTARTHSNPEVRKQAMFWLGQSEDPRALAFFEEVLTR
jgi:hypothetical protein